MAETVHIKELGDLVADEIFRTFKWEVCKFPDVNWACASPKTHKSAGATDLTHPSDQVYHYFDPYKGEEIYINFDFKSYAKSTLESYDPSKDLISLGKAVECANKSSDFKKLYVVDENKSHFVDGALFVYNHDGDYDREFDALLERKIAKEGICSLKGDSRLFVFSPQDIVELYSISRDFNILKGKEGAGIVDAGFRSPDLQHSKVLAQKKVGSATIEMLTSSWVVADIHTKDPTGNCRYVYLKEPDMNVDGYKYLIDAILHFQLLEDYWPIKISDLYFSNERLAAFNTALDQYVNDSHGVNDESVADFKSRLDKIKYRSVNMEYPSFFEREIARDA